VNALDFSPDGQAPRNGGWILRAGGEKEALAGHRETFSSLTKLHSDSGMALRFSPNGKLLAISAGRSAGESA